MKRWPLHKAYFWETAPFFRILLPLAAGIVGYELTRGFFCARVSSLLFFAACFIGYVGIASARSQKKYFPLVGFLLLSGMFFSGGYSLSVYNDIRNDKHQFTWCANRGIAHLVRITGIPAEKESTWKIPVTVLAAIDSNKAGPVTGKAFLYLHKSNYPLRLQKGDSIITPGRWQEIRTAGNHFEFDYAAYCRRNGITRQQFCNRSDIIIYGQNDPAANPLTERVHEWCMAQLDTYIKEKKTRGLMQAMLLGDEVNLDGEMRTAYADTGIVHIIAISGGNVAIFFLVVSFLLLWLRHNKYAWVKYLIALPLVWFYVLMAGSSPSAVRAAVMFSLLAGSVMLQKNNNSLNQLFATAVVLLCAQPMWLFSLGFQLSFVAVLSLILFYTPVYHWLPRQKYWIMRALWGTAAASIAAEVLVAPVVIYYFQTFPLMFLVANVAAYLFMSMVLIMGIAIIAVGWLPAVATLLGTGTIAIVGWFGHIVSWLQGLSPVSFHFLMLNGAELAVSYLAISGILYFALRKHKPALFAGLGALCILLCLLCADEWMAVRQRKLVVYNIAKTNYAELVNGKEYQQLSTNFVDEQKKLYATKEAHTRWGAWRKKEHTEQELFSIGGKTILVLSAPVESGGNFPVDYVVVNNAGEPDIEQLKTIFSPQKVVITKSHSPHQSDDPTIYDIANDGAFLIE